MDLHWLPIQERIQYKLCVLVFKYKHSLAPAYLTEQLQQVAHFGVTTAPQIFQLVSVRRASDPKVDAW